jgi:hypothetical protein
MEVRLLFQFHYDKNSINTDEKPDQSITHRLKSILKTQKTLDEKTIARYETDKKLPKVQFNIGFIAWPAATTKP